MSTGILGSCNYPNLGYLKLAHTGINEQNEFCPSGVYFIGATRSISYLASSYGSLREDFGIPLHWKNPEYTDLEKYSTDNPPLFGFLYGINTATASQTDKLKSKKIDQKCLSTYARFNLIQNKEITTMPDQALLGRYDKFTQEYYHDFLSENINELTSEVVKWREYGWWPYLLTPISISFWIGGCGEPCYVCSYAGHFCYGNAEHALNITIYALDNYWAVEKAENGILWPSDKFLVDYYGIITRGPEPIIGWNNYLLAKNATCSYCGCIIFCILAACIDPWFMRYSATSSVITFNSADGIPQRLPGKFIEYVEYLEDQLKQDDIQKKPIFFDHMPQERLFIDGKADYYTAQIYNAGGINAAPSGYLLGSQLDSKQPGSQIIGQDYIYLENETKFAFATITEHSGFHIEKENLIGSGCSEEDIKNNNCYSVIKDSVFFGFRTRGAADDKGYIIRNVANKYYNHNVRKDIFKYNWLYVDIPNPLRTQVTPAITSFDSLDVPELYFQDIDPLIVMRKNVLFKTILKSGDIILNGNGSSKLYIQQWFNLFENTSMDDRYYPFLWIDRIEKKIIKTPYNLYFKSGDQEFKECMLGETLYDLAPGRYYFPNPYACKATPKTSVYDGNTIGGEFGKNYLVYDFSNHEKYFSTYLPMQFLGISGENIKVNNSGNIEFNENGIIKKDYKKMLDSAKEILGNPESGSFAIAATNDKNFYVAGPIEEFPNLILLQDGNTKIIDWSDTNLPWYKEGKFDRLKMLEDQKGLFLADLRNYDKKWWSGYLV